MKSNKRSPRDHGSIGDLLTTGICVLAMVTLLFSFLQIYEILHIKAQVGQVARQYILRMETKGYLDAGDKSLLLSNLQELQISQVDFCETTTKKAGYGGFIVLHVKGKIMGKYEIEEKRVSTAKN